MLQGLRLVDLEKLIAAAQNAKKAKQPEPDHEESKDLLVEDADEPEREKEARCEIASSIPFATWEPPVSFYLLVASWNGNAFLHGGSYLAPSINAAVAIVQSNYQ